MWGSVSEVWLIAMPYKVFEYLGHGIPMISSDELAVGDFVKEKNVGWTIPYDAACLHKLLQKLLNDQKEVSQKKVQSKILAAKNTWINRAKKVENDLCQINEKE